MSSTATVTDREPLVDAAAVAGHLGYSKKWIERHAEELGIPRRKIGGQWRFRISEVDSWIDTQGQPLVAVTEDDE